MSIYKPEIATPLPADFAAVQTGGAGGVAIRIGEFLNGDGFKNYEHALVCVGPGPEGSPPTTVQILQAEPGGAQIVYRDCQATDLWSTGIIIQKPSQRKMAQNIAHDFEGIGYSPEDYFAIAAHRLHIPVPGLQNYIGDTGHMICSQLVDEFELRLGNHLFDDGRWPGYVTPEALANLLISKLRAGGN